MPEVGPPKQELTPGFIRGFIGVLDALGNANNFIDAYNKGDRLGMFTSGLGILGGVFQAFGACFAAGTPILTPDGPKPIEDLRPGDLVMSRREDDPAAPAEARIIEDVFERIGEVWDLEVAGQVIRTTAEHPFWAEGRGWTAAARLVEGDRLATLDGGWSLVGGVSSSGQLMTVYNMRVAEYHTYFVGRTALTDSVWSHNMGKCDIDAPNTDALQAVKQAANSIDKGVAAAIQVGRDSYNGFSTLAGGGQFGSLHPLVQTALEKAPDYLKNMGIFGACAEPRAISNALFANLDVAGAKIAVRDFNNQPMLPCAACQYLLNYFGVKYVR